MAEETLETPAVILDQAVVEANCARIARFCDQAGCRLLYAAKAASLPELLVWIGGHVEGFSTSSPGEVRLVRDALGPGPGVHFTSPGLRPAEAGALRGEVDYLSFNSCSQLRRIAPMLGPETRLGIRVNPELSLVADSRYDPCRPHSKLGAPLGEVRALLDAGAGPRVSGLLVHNNCEAEDLSGLARTVAEIVDALGDRLHDLDWINLGGGYALGGDACPPELISVVRMLRERHGLEVFIEPGRALVQDGAEIVASVVDRFESGGRTVAVLDTTVNHMPEVFEYQYEPDVLGHRDDAPHPVILAGASCLAGDVFGDYRFDAPLRPGDRVVFPEMGAYTLVKAHAFNGIALPALYIRARDGSLVRSGGLPYHPAARDRPRGSGFDADAIA